VISLYPAKTKTRTISSRTPTTKPATGGCTHRPVFSSCSFTTTSPRKPPVTPRMNHHKAKSQRTREMVRYLQEHHRSNTSSAKGRGTKCRQRVSARRLESASRADQLRGKVLNGGQAPARMCFHTRKEGATRRGATQRTGQWWPGPTRGVCSPSWPSTPWASSCT
jgi:hypothetical protein